MSQPVRGSALEAVANVITWLVLGLLLQAGLHGLYGLRSTGPQQLSIAMAFTLSSLLRSFALRRLFKRLGVPRRCQSCSVPHLNLAWSKMNIAALGGLAGATTPR